MRPAPMSARTPGQGARLLLVEDDPIGAEWLLHTLGGWGLAVEHTLDCSSTLARTDLHSFAGLLLDQRLPDGAGEDLLAALRARGVEHPAIALSADIDPLQQARLEHAGFVMSLRKPIEVGALLEALQALAVPPPPWDEARALACANGRISIAQSLRALLLAELPAQRVALRAACTGNAIDRARAEGLLHRMLGAARLTGASALAAHIESARAALEDSFNEAPTRQAIERLDRHIAELLNSAPGKT
jgi:DNA-binding response OmpR family regulator